LERASRNVPPSLKAFAAMILLRFLGEQDGPFERILKEKLANEFRYEPGIRKAYLARAEIGESRVTSVVLALLAVGTEENRLVQRVGSIFATVFNVREHLDVVFLTPQYESQLTNVCTPFFERDS
jgi:SseB protein C-terminal domain